LKYIKNKKMNKIFFVYKINYCIKKIRKIKEVIN